MLTDQEQENIMRHFPKFKLFYETNISKIICNYEYYLAIPYGIKCFLWFTEYRNQNICILLEIEANNQISSLKIVNCCFHSHLSYGTIFYGVKQTNSQYFFLLDILYYKGRDYSNTYFHKNLFTFKNIFQNEIKQIAYTNNIVIVGLPVITKSYEELLSVISNLPYKIAYIQTVNGNKRYNLFDIKPVSAVPNMSVPINNIRVPNIRIPIKQKKPNNIFKVKADIQNDIYIIDQGDYTDIAYIPNYTTSVMMNKLFRNIKENDNLDALEESDSEDEFENDKPDKFVYLERSYNMECIFSYRFKKWIPVKVV